MNLTRKQKAQLQQGHNGGIKPRKPPEFPPEPPPEVKAIFEYVCPHCGGGLTKQAIRFLLGLLKAAQEGRDAVLGDCDPNACKIHARAEVAGVGVDRECIGREQLLTINPVTFEIIEGEMPDDHID